VNQYDYGLEISPKKEKGGGDSASILSGVKKRRVTPLKRKKTVE